MQQDIYAWKSSQLKQPAKIGSYQMMARGCEVSRTSAWAKKISMHHISSTVLYSSIIWVFWFQRDYSFTQATLETEVVGRAAGQKLSSEEKFHSKHNQLGNALMNANRASRKPCPEKEHLDTLKSWKHFGKKILRKVRLCDMKTGSELCVRVLCL